MEFIKSYETNIMIRKINANLLRNAIYGKHQSWPKKRQKYIADVMMVNNIVVYSVADAIICLYILIIMVKRFL